jgi:hypothetical protein
MTAGHIYTVAGDGQRGTSGYGGPAQNATVPDPSSVSTDSAGDLIIAQPGYGEISVVAARTGTFYGLAMTAGDIYKVAGDGNYGFSGDGGPATSAALNFPEGVTVDAAGNVVIADTDNNRVRVVAAAAGTFYGQAMTVGDIYTVAGDGVLGYSGDGGPATHADIAEPGSVAASPAGDLLIGTPEWVRMVTG